MMCLECKFIEVLQDNHSDTHSICVCQESNNFLRCVSLVFDGCEHIEKEKDEEEESEKSLLFADIDEIIDSVV